MTSGVYKASLITANSARDFRHYVRHGLATVPLVVPSLDLLMNRNLDESISVWDSLFLPVNLRNTFMQLDRVDDSNNIVTGEP